MSLSPRGQRLVRKPDHDWPTRHTYDRDTNPDGMIAPCSALNPSVASELEDFAKNVPITAQHLIWDHPESECLNLRTGLASHLSENFHPHEPIGAEHIVIAETASAVIEQLGFVLASHGEGFLTSRPQYREYSTFLPSRGGVEVCFADTDAEGSLDANVLIGEFEKALVRYGMRGVRIRAVLISNPNNPLGRCYPRATLIAIMKFCHAHSLHLISDEIFGATVFETPRSPDAVPFTSVLSINTSPSITLIDPSSIHVVYGFAKDFGAAGLRIGALISQHNADLLAAANESLRFTDISGPAGAMATAMLAAQNSDWLSGFLARTRAGLARMYDHTAAKLDELGIGYVRGGNAGFFVFVDLSPYLKVEGLMEGKSSETAKSSSWMQSLTSMVVGMGAGLSKDGDAAAAGDGGDEYDHGRGPLAEAEDALVQKMVDNGLFLNPRGERYPKPGWFRFVFTHEPHVIDEAFRRLQKALSS